LFWRARWVKFPNVPKKEGMEPVREQLFKFKSTSFWRPFISAGITPLSFSELSISSVSFVNPPNDEGIVPTNF
jgi:hypothetical protein